MVHEVVRAEKFAELRLRIKDQSRRARSRRAPRRARTFYPWPCGKQVDVAEVRIVVAAVLAAAADAVLVAHHLPKLGAHLVTALARLYMHNLA